MASAADNRHRRCHQTTTNLCRFLHAASSNFSSLITTKATSSPSPASKIHLPLLLPHSPLSLASLFDSAQSDSLSRSQSGIPSASSPSSSAINGMPSSERSSGFPSAVRLSAGGGGGPAFVGQVFSMCDLSGTGLMAVSTHFDVPFLSKRTPEWLKKMFATITKSQRNGPVFRFFMDLGDAVSYVKQLNIPSGVVGACRLDIAYEHFKEKPDLFQFVPNERQVKEANKLLKTLPYSDGRKKVDGVPVFGSENLDIAIATTEGIKWYTPYFFDKNMLDNILEESVDQHFHSLIENRHLQRRKDVVDDSLTAEVVEEMGETMWEPPEVQEVLDEMGHPGIPFSVISKAAEIQILYAVDKVLLGNRWLRRATGIQPKFPYVVDSFEKKTAASFLRAKQPLNLISNSEFDENSKLQYPGLSERDGKDSAHDKKEQSTDFRFPFGDWFTNPWSKDMKRQQKLLDTREHRRREPQPSPFLPKVTMVGISTGEPGKMSKATLKRTMEDLTKELEQLDQENQVDVTNDEYTVDERDPLFVANVGDYYSSLTKPGSARWVRGRSN